MKNNQYYTQLGLWGDDLRDHLLTVAMADY